MWILPKQLISAFAPGTEALTSDSVECSQTCERSLMRRSKPSQSKIYLREWKAGNLMRLRSGAISSLSLGQSFLGWWTSSLAVTRVSHSVQPESAPEQTTQDTCGHTSQKEFAFSSQPYAYLKTSKAILRWDSPQLSVIWKKWVTRCRGEYSQRLNAARLTNESACSSWPTASTRDHKGGYEGGRIRDGKVSMDTLDVAVQAYSAGGLTDPANPSAHGSRPESWATPRAEHDSGRHRGQPDTLHSQMKAWATPHANCSTGAGQAPEKQRAPNLQTQASGKLNPRWVETLMGLPVGWTMPSCAQPVTTVQTNCACSATESSQQQQP